MTEKLFKDSIFDWGDLQSFCSKYGYFDSYISDSFHSATLLRRLIQDLTLAELSGTTWHDIQYKLAYIEVGECYHRRGALDYIRLDNDDFLEHRGCVLQWAIDHGIVLNDDTTSQEEQKSDITEVNLLCHTLFEAFCRLIRGWTKQLFRQLGNK